MFKFIKRVIDELRYQRAKRIIPWLQKRFVILCNKRFVSWMSQVNRNKSDFVEYTNEPYHPQEGNAKIFAFYLPQFHCIPENDIAHGKGFTEWTNVATCSPQFVGHFQPKIPYDLGFYNLLLPGVIDRQVEIAKAYGIYGFCFYYYWFSGKKVLEKPLEYFLNSSIDFHYHFCWANENWSKLWDGGSSEVIIKQAYKVSDADLFFEDILPFIKDPRYEKINNKPLLIIYSSSEMSKEYIKMFVARLNELAIENGFNGFYITTTPWKLSDNPHELGLHGITEFPPHGVNAASVFKRVIDKNAKFSIKDMDSYIRKGCHINDKPDYTVFKTCFPSWDNLPRKLYSNGRCYLLSDSMFERWLESILKWTKTNNSPEEQYVYINAWNEWAEGAILEPTTKYGYKYLDIIKKVLERCGK